MSDEALVREILRQILQATQTISRRFSRITSPADFTSSEEGMEKLDAICMQLIAIGESVKHLDRVTDGALLSRYPEVEWRRIMGMRDVLSHHYFDLDAETVYEVCASHIAGLGETIQRILADLHP
jgi:uncharacterized protein with HEPN domain